MCIRDRSSDKYKDFREWIQKQAEIYAQDILGYDTSDFLLTDSWLNVCDSGGKQSPHFHINAVVCALYYVYLADESHSPTYFYRPNNSMNYPDYFAYMLTNQKETKYNYINEVVGVEGSLLLWPANTCHGYTTNHTDNRITVSSVIFDAPIGPEILTSNPEGKFQTQIRVTFTIYEDL